MDQRIADLFEKMKARNLFWSYSGKILPKDVKPDLFVETVLKYGDVDDIRVLFECYDSPYIREVWIRRLLFDNRFRKLNFNGSDLRGGYH
ncbi:MAG: hypothetical protein KGY38_04925 [Desulfobacterales bacterium]|nr:hypothetical protein [Desulfobacterales bacterium]